MPGYAKQRSNWLDYPTTSTPILAANLNAWEQAIYDMKHTSFPIQDPAESLVISGAASQSADLIQVKDSTGNLVSKWGSDGRFYIDPTSVFLERSAILTLARNLAAPTGVQFTTFSVTEGKGDNTTVKGVGSGFLQVRDRSDVVAGNKGTLYGLNLSLVPLVARNNTPADDVTGLIIQNDAAVTGRKATEAVFVGHNSLFTAGAMEWSTTLGLYANSDAAIRLAGTYQYGLDCDMGGVNAVFTQAAIRIPNNAKIVSRNFADTTDNTLIYMGADDTVRAGPNSANGVALNTNGTDRLFISGAGLMSLSDGVNIFLGSTNGTKIGTAATQKLGFWNATPIVRPTGWTAATGTATRTTFATSTVTLPVLAEHVKALIDDLIAEGLIGA